MEGQTPDGSRADIHRFKYEPVAEYRHRVPQTLRPDLFESVYQWLLTYGDI